jgi:hypothetical protein
MVKMFGSADFQTYMAKFAAASQKNTAKVDVKPDAPEQGGGEA